MEEQIKQKDEIKNAVLFEKEREREKVQETWTRHSNAREKGGNQQNDEERHLKMTAAKQA